MVIDLNTDNYPEDFWISYQMIVEDNGGKATPDFMDDFMLRCKLEKDRYLLTGKCYDQTEIMKMIAVGFPSPPITELPKDQ